MNDNTAYRYNVAIESPVGQTLVQWGADPNWMEINRELLATAHTLSLIPKDGQALPVVSVRVDADRRWILFSRVYGRVTGPGQVRLYAIGWQSTVRGVNVKAIQWVYPTGAIESADDPTYWERFLG